MWQDVLRPHIEAGKLAVVGVVQEQHPDRARLYRQWRQFDWPIFVDSLNTLDMAVVPAPVAIDAAGIVRHTRITPQNVVADFIEADYPAVEVSPSSNRASEPDIDRLRHLAKQMDTAKVWRDLGDACFLAAGGDLGRLDAVEAYQRAVAIDPKDGRAHFRLGVALWRRSETRRRRPGDAQAAVERWGLALSANPKQYIWRRRIQQYGPRLDKPYDFFSWVEQARKDILARGETPVTLSAEPIGSEIAGPKRSHGLSGEGPGQRLAKACGPVSDRIQPDTAPYVQIETMVTPARVRPGHGMRARLTFRLNESTRPFWNNEADCLRLCLDLPAGLTLGEGALAYANPPKPETQEVRVLEFELAVGKAIRSGRVELPCYALYYVCGSKGGKCYYQRKDVTLTVDVDPYAPTLR